MISAVLNETKLTPAKSGHIPTQLLYLSVSCHLSIDVGICFLQHPISRKEHQTSSRLPYHLMGVGNSGLTKLISCQIRLGQVLQVHRLALWVVTYIHAKELMYDLSNNTVALRNFLPTAYGSRCFFQEFTVVNHTNLSLASALLEVIITLRLYLSCNLPPRYQGRSFKGE